VAEKTPRMQQIEALLADDPTDSFLRYGLAMEHAGAGDPAEAARLLLEQVATDPYVPAYLMAGQYLARLGRESEACDVLRRGIEAAQKQGNTHALGEMQGLLATLE
jgi:hypothetical protein